MLERLRLRLQAPVELSSLAVFRIALGLLMAVSAVRFMAHGWVERFFVERTFFFHYWGFEWVAPWPAWGMYVHYSALAACGVLVALGLYYRVAVIALLVLFTYAELIDVTNYLNHYYLVSLLLLWMSALPLHGMWSYDARRRPDRARTHLPALALWGLRAQVAVVYVHAALAKWGSDWLQFGQPLNLWLNARRDMPVVGDFLADPNLAIALGWAGMLHDLCVVPLLLWRRTRVFGYAWLLTFHFGTNLLFNIGIFPWLMPMAATLFFAPDWPRKLLDKIGRPRSVPVASEPARLSPVSVAVVALFVALQALLPLRTHLYGGDVLWHEQGMRWSWRVMVREKQGAITYRATLPDQREVEVSPRKYLSAAQEREMSGQPDLILQLGQHIGRELAARAGGPVAVRVDALVSLNGRRYARLIDPEVDLMQIRDGVAPASWILPAPTEPPPALGGRRMAVTWP